MNIKDIINAERWQPFDRGTKPYVTSHNTALDRIETAMTKHITELEEHIPKIIRPKNSDCVCGYTVQGFDQEYYKWRYNYCPECGSKLNWEDGELL